MKQETMPVMIKKLPGGKTDTHIEVLPQSVYALRGIIFYTVAKINQNLPTDFCCDFISFFKQINLYPMQ